ncbi:MAG: FtsK/SpoIIIE domain-containing protein, partial [Planctomyces sp.]
RSTMLRLLTSFPPGKLRFTILDPVGLGQSFAGFMHLADYEDALVTDRIWTEPRHIEARLTDLTEHMENVIQKYLRNQFKSIEEYNEQAGEIAEPYRFLVIADFPANFSEVSAKRLASILASGPRCGVYTLIAMDTRQQLPAGLTAADLKRNALRFTYRKGDPAATPPTAPGLVWDDPDFGSLPVAVEQPPDDERFNALVHRVGVASKDANRVQVPFAMIAPQREQLWTMSSASEVRVALGRAGATKLQHLSLGRGTSQHALIAGRTGSGKSTLLHAIITNLAMWYTPDEVELYLIDFKKGVEFKAYASLGLPHARVIAIESEREFGLSVLRKLDAELKRRGNLFRDQEVQDLKSFRSARADVPMPRIMLIVDEFQELFVEDDKLAQEASLLLDRLVRQGRAFGMHVILGSQTLGGAYSLARATIGQMAVRIALQCSEADAMLIMSDDNSAPRLLNRPGEAIYNDASGAIEGNSPFQVAWLPDEQREHFLSQVRSRIPTLPESTRARLVPPIVFEGNVPANIEANHPLSLALAAAAPVEHGKPTNAWLGDAIAIKDPSAGIFRRQAGANLLIVGQKDDSALAMMVASILSLAAQHAQRAGTDAASPAPRIYLLDGTPADQPGFGVLPKLAASLSDVLDIRVIALRDVPGAMNELNAELSRRTALAAESESGSAQPPSWYLFVHALQRYRALRRSENEFDFSASTGDEPDAQVAPEKAFANIMREGAAMGIHTLCWCDTVANLTRTLERNALREFDQRVLFQMSGADSSALMDTPFAGTIGNNRALLYSEEQGSVEKFRPYAMPGDAWLAATINRLTRRTPTPEPTR